MPETIPTVTKDPKVRFPSTWKDPRGKPLTDAAISEYARLGVYGPDEQRKQRARDNSRVLDGIVMLGQPCEKCKDTMGQYMNFSYLPQAGYYCNHCREDYKNEKLKEREARLRYYRIESFE